MFRRMATLGTVLALGVGMGCAGTRVTPEDRDLMWQNEQGAIVIKETARQPEVSAIAADLEQNSIVLRKNYGDPEKKAPYSSEASAAARKASEESHTRSWLLAGLYGALGIFVPILTNRFAPGLGGIVSNLVGGVFKSKDKKLSEATMAGIEQYMKANPSAEKLVAGFLKRAQKKLGVEGVAEKLLGQVKSNVVPELPSGPPPAPSPPSS